MTNPTTTDLLAPGRNEPLPEPASPDRALRRRLWWLLTIAAPAAWVVAPALVALAAGPPNYEINVSLPSVIGLLAMTALSMWPVLICLVTVWAVLLHERLAATLPRGAAQLVVLYLSVMALMQRDEPRLWSLPWAVALGLGSFVVPPLVVSFVLRWFRWRLVRRRGGDSPLPPLAPRYQFRLADVFAWMTLLAVFLGLGTALLTQFNKEPTGWEGLGPAIIVMICLTLCGPTGILSVVFVWLVLAEKRRLARGIVAICVALAWVGWTIYVLIEYGPRPFSLSPDAYLALAAPPALALPALLLLALARLAGWRMLRLSPVRPGLSGDQ